MASKQFILFVCQTWLWPIAMSKRSHGLFLHTLTSSYKEKHNYSHSQQVSFFFWVIVCDKNAFEKYTESQKKIKTQQ